MRGEKAIRNEVRVKLRHPKSWQSTTYKTAKAKLKKGWAEITNEDKNENQKKKRFGREGIALKPAQ